MDAKTTTKTALEAAGRLALAAQAVLKAEDDAFGKLRKALMYYDREIIALHDAQRNARRRKKS